ncbi:L-serine ammonia-lyase, iron-sulfur-dependent subunit beta [Konateibacter massiliensis]|uniref:L-serine ammonia-lyase, iron-sulfur-dependent subunit beta n=1 Tax=Konateibacter massiliensis TaxID=2002841 RepID=UPI000C14FAD4|nr:L-serine ammonia-lyase, iron-sulfur-dependent subunit beta [Konateibacter massiliensis]
MTIFDILGPVMVGPSSSHTAGAVKIGLVASRLLGDIPQVAEIYFHGSFAATGEGHGTDRAIVAGLLGMEPDNMDIPRSFEIAKEKNMEFEISNIFIKDAHPNTVLLELFGEGDKKLKIQAASIGGGRIMIRKLDDIDVNFTGENPTLIVHNQDEPGHVAKVTSALAEKGVNIATMQLYRDKRGGYAVMVIETDQPIPKDFIEMLSCLDGVIKVTCIEAV